VNEIAIKAVSVDRLLEELRDEVVDLWLRAHQLPASSPTRREFGKERLPRHSARKGFRFRGAFAPSGELAGFVYGYTGAPGQWWFDKVAAALGDETRRIWMDPGHFEFTELAVRPDYQGRGIGGRLHDSVLDGLPHRRALLSALADNVPVVGFYKRRGWRILLERLRFEPGRPNFSIMGRELG
jgi:ribosomal protein S18 acetylase RimI-like enzyme